jgi:hypothetical protein
MNQSEITFYNSDTGIEWKLSVESEARLMEFRSFLNEFLKVEGSPASLRRRPDSYVVTSAQYAEIKRYLSEHALK